VVDSGQNNIILSETTEIHNISELQLNLKEHINMCFCNFNKISIKRNTQLQEKFNLTVNFDFF